MTKAKVEIFCKEETCIQKTPVALIEQSMIRMEEKIDLLKEDIDDFIKEVKEGYVTKEQFNNTISSLEDKEDKQLLLTTNNIYKWFGMFILFLTASAMGNNFGNILQYLANLFK